MRQAVLDNVEADFNLVNSMIDQINSESVRLSTDYGLSPLLSSEAPHCPYGIAGQTCALQFVRGSSRNNIIFFREFRGKRK